MRRRKNLERAIVLGLLLSTSVYGSAWADKTYTISDFRNLGTEISVNENTTVEGTGTSIGGDEVNNTIVGKVITVGDGVVLNLNNLAGNHMNIKGNGDINITLEHNAGANGGAIYMNGDITANKLSIDTSATSATKGIYTYGGDVNIDVNELSIKANSHGIFTTGDATSDVIINDTQKVIIETNSFARYKELKDMYSDSEWNSVKEKIISKIKSNSRDILEDIYMEENETNKLFELLKKNPSLYRLAKYQDAVKDKYGKELLNFYKPQILEESKKVSDRKWYQELCHYIRKMKEIDNSDDFIFDMLKEMYPNYRSKRAFKEEIMNVLSPKNKQRFYELIEK